MSRFPEAVSVNLIPAQAIALITGASVRLGWVRRLVGEAWHTIVIAHNIERLMSTANPPAGGASRQLPAHDSDPTSQIEFVARMNCCGQVPPFPKGNITDTMDRLV
jgi:hypothetical protein